VALSWRGCSIECEPVKVGELLLSMRWYVETQGFIVWCEFGVASSRYLEIGRLRSSNCNSDTIDGLPDWVVVEKQEYDLPKEAIRQLYCCYKI